MLKSVNAQDYMTDQPLTVKADTDIFNVIDMLILHKVSGATVIDDENNVVGVISEVDCLRAILNSAYHSEKVGGKVSEYMTKEVESLTRDMDIVAVAQKMLDSKRRRIPVVENGKFVGQLSIRSILRAVKNFESGGRK